MPDIFIQEFYPRVAPLFTQVSVKIFVLNVNYENKYWCLSNDGQLNSAILTKEVILNHNMERIFLYCHLQVQYFPRRLYLNILSNSGQSLTKVENFIDYLAPVVTPDPYHRDLFFLLV